LDNKLPLLTSFKKLLKFYYHAQTSKQFIFHPLMLTDNTIFGFRSANHSTPSTDCSKKQIKIVVRRDFDDPYAITQQKQQDLLIERD